MFLPIFLLHFSFNTAPGITARFHRIITESSVITILLEDNIKRLRKVSCIRNDRKRENVFLQSMAEFRLQCRSVLCSTSLIVAVIQQFPCHLINLRSWGHSPHLRPMWPVSSFSLKTVIGVMTGFHRKIRFSLHYVLFCFFFLAQALLVFMALRLELSVRMEFYSRNILCQRDTFYTIVLPW